MGVLLGVIFLNEQLSWRLLTGGVFVVAGVAIVNSKNLQILKKQKVSRP